MKKNILVLYPFNDEQKCQLQAIAPEENYTFALYETVTLAQIKRAHAIIGGPPVEMLRQAENLEWFQLPWSGIDFVTKTNSLPPQPIYLTNVTGVFGAMMAEFILGMILMLSRSMHLYRDQQNEEVWEFLWRDRMLADSDVLMIGMGDVGSEFAQRANALGARVTGIRRANMEKPPYAEAVHPLEKIDDLLPGADIVVLCLPGTPETERVMSRARIELMKNGAILINVGRGAAVDTEALCDALEAGKLWGAGLDVTDPEPLPKGHRLWKMKNAIITPHCAGVDYYPDVMNKAHEICMHNLHAYLNDPSKMTHLVDMERGYGHRPTK